VGLELVKRTAGTHEGSPLGKELKRFAREFEGEREDLKKLIEHLGSSPDRIKVAGGWLMEKAGRAKLNGSLFSYSPLSQVVELEGLRLGVEGKLSLWLGLRKLAKRDERLRIIDLEGLIKQARAQRDVLERERLKAVTKALGS